jgi:hypothetical protein
VMPLKEQSHYASSCSLLLSLPDQRENQKLIR